MVLLAETRNTPRRVWVKRYTVDAHARKPPKGADIFSWKKHEKHRN